jgi:hypothetical protein
MRTTRKTLVVVLATLIAVPLLLWLWNRTVLIQEETAPDFYQLGHVDAGSTVEFSARFLVSARDHPFDAFFNRVLEQLPQAWEPILSKVHPKNFRKAPAAVDPSTLKPSINAPAFIRVRKATPDCRTNWYRGWPFVVLDMTVDTARPGYYAGEVEVTMKRRRATFPVRVTVREKPPDTPELLVASSPFESYATEHGAQFEATTDLMASLPFRVNYLQNLPPHLEPYRVILLADSALVKVNADEISRLRSFVEKGGRLILACNAFMSRSVPRANEIIAGYGMEVVDDDFGRYVTVTNLAPHRMTHGVQRAEFHRPSLIQITDSSKAKALALAPNGKGGFVAASGLNTGGEIVVLTSSLWWHWLHTFKTNSDNAQLMRNILTPDHRLSGR